MPRFTQISFGHFQARKAPNTKNSRKAACRTIITSPRKRQIIVVSLSVCG